MDRLCFVPCVSHAFTSVHCCLVVTCWERADLLALFGDVYCMCCYLPMWYPGSGVVLFYERDFMMSLSGDKQADIIDTFNTSSRYLNDILNIIIFILTIW